MKDGTATTLLVIALVVALLVYQPEVIDTVVDMVTGSRTEFLSTLGGQVQNYLAAARPDLTDGDRTTVAQIVAAQGAHETGYGRSIAWRTGYNFGNITAGSSWRGAVVNGGDTDGNGAPITQRFRSYPDLDTAVSDFFSFLGSSRYAGARDLLFQGDAEGYIRALHDAGYYTASADSYVAGVNSALSAAQRVIA